MSHTPPNDAQQDNSIRLKAGIRFVPERSESGWHCVLEDTSTKRFFRIGRREYLIASCLQRAKTPLEIGKLLNDTQPDLDIQATEIEQAIRWLINVGLVVTGNASNQDNAGKSGTPSQPTAAASWIDPFMMRFTLISGDSLERWLRPLLFLVSFPLIVIAACLILLAGILFTCNYSDLMGLSSKLFVPSAAGWWLIAWLVMKAFHELGHALVCMGHGGEVRGAGVGVFYLAPVPYVDTTDMWRLSSRKARAFCALGGIWFEMTIAAIAILVCQATENSSLQYFCVSLATMGTFTTLAFNANPLAKFDGYFVLSDLLNRPNLWTEAQQALRSAIKDGWTMNRHSPKAFQGVMLTAYGALASLYRYTMMLAIGWGAWLTYRGVGLGLISLAVYLWFIAPWLKGRQLRRSQQMLATGSVDNSPFWRSPKSVKRFGLIAGAVVGCMAILFVPSPWQPAAPGYVVFEEPITLRSQTEGIVGKVYYTHGDVVQQGDSIVEIENPLLQLQVEQLRCAVEMSDEHCRVLRAQDRMAEYQSEQARLYSTQEQLKQAEEKLAGLTIRAPKTGRLVARELNRFEGQFIKSGQPIAALAASSSIEIRCSLPQDDVEMYRRQIGKAMSVTIADSGKINATLKEVLPRASDVLDNPALAARYGGPIGVQVNNSNDSNDSKSPIKTLRPRFEAKMSIDPSQAKSLSLGEICNVHPASESFTLANVIGRWKNELVHWLFPIGKESTI